MTKVRAVLANLIVKKKQLIYLCTNSTVLIIGNHDLSYDALRIKDTYGIVSAKRDLTHTL